MLWIYNISLFFYRSIIWFISPFNTKAKKWQEGRKNVFEKLINFASKNKKNIWVHCASVGEFEQGFPLIKKLENNYPNYTILISFFSPSGYEYVQSKFPNLNIIYLPLDSKKNSRRWIYILQPELAIFIKYEFWHHYYSEIKKSNIPLLVVSAIFWKELFFFKSYGRFFRKALKKVTHFFVQDEESKSLLSNIEIRNVSVSGDVRFERVLDIRNEQFENAKIKTHIGSAKVFVAGSVWNADIPVLKSIIKTLPDDYKIILAPHEIENFDYAQFSSFTTQNFTSEVQKETKILFLDTIGILSKVYRYSDITYVGGGFGKGIHNVLEAAVYCQPIIIGPNYQRFLEAKQLKELGTLFVIEGAAEVNTTVRKALLLNEKDRNRIENFFAKNANVSEQIIVFIKKGGFLD